MSPPALLTILARALLAGKPDVAAITERLRHVLGRSRVWLPRLAEQYVSAFTGKTVPRQREVEEFLRRNRLVQKAARPRPPRSGAPAFLDPARLASPLKVRSWITGPRSMQPVAAASSWDLPVIETTGALAEWLWLDPEHLLWYADLAGINSGRTGHYHYRLLTKRSGGVRLIECPKTHLKRIQRQILREILAPVPPHPNVHGFVRGRSVRSFAVPHAGQYAVLRLDLQDFFPSIRARRIQAAFRTFGYPEPVADLLGGLCTNLPPRGLFPDRNARDLYARPHLPQGAPTSPALANLCAYRADCRLSGLARSAGAVYTRYADDLAFSGAEDFARSAERFATHAAAILIEEGFNVNHRKTRLMREGVRQHLAGLVINRVPNVPRREFDQLKAILTNCVRHGAGSQNREGRPAFREHLEGRVSYVGMIRPDKGARLRAILDQIEW